MSGIARSPIPYAICVLLLNPPPARPEGRR
jgi:hypothetical protein